MIRYMMIDIKYYHIRYKRLDIKYKIIRYRMRDINLLIIHNSLNFYIVLGSINANPKTSKKIVTAFIIKVCLRQNNLNI